MELEQAALKHGLQFSRNTCELLNMGPVADVHWKDGSPVPRTEAARYLGIMLDRKGHLDREVQIRVRDATVTWKR